MVKFRGEGPAGTVFGFGLSDMNLARLKAGEPIAVDLAELGGAGQVVIFHGVTEEAIGRKLAALGVFDEDTVISVEQGSSHAKGFMEAMPGGEAEAGDSGTFDTPGGI